MRFNTIEEFKEVYNDWKESKLTIREFCSRNGLKEVTFYYWKKRIVERQNISVGKFVPVQASPQISQSSSHKAIPSDVKVSDAPDNECCEIVYANGVTLKLRGNISLDMLRTLISLNP